MFISKVIIKQLREIIYIKLNSSENKTNNKYIII